MARQHEVLVQGRLFAAEPTAVAPETRRRTGSRGGGRVTRDPAVALAYQEGVWLGHSTKLGLARILASRSPAEREAIRTLLAKPQVA